jgi:hypothetical protein
MATDSLVFGRLLTTLATIVACSGNCIGTRVLARAMIEVIAPAQTRFHPQVCLMYACLNVSFLFGACSGVHMYLGACECAR